jgi:hypothetical protein
VASFNRLLLPPFTTTLRPLFRTTNGRKGSARDSGARQSQRLQADLNM